MPELAEVEFYRRRWDAGIGGRVLAVGLHPRARDFRGMNPRRLRSLLLGTVLSSSEARGKQMLFRFRSSESSSESGSIWLGIHLGMSGRLWVREEEGAAASQRAAAPAVSQRATRHTARTSQRHDHLVLRLPGRSLVFSDPRQFGRVRVARGAEPPNWWLALAPGVLTDAFTPESVAAFLHRHARAPIKSVLLMQEGFPGIGNWMADEILFRSGIHPRAAAGACAAGAGLRLIWKETRAVSRTALHVIGNDWDDLPRGWLFHRRWRDGERCPRTGVPLVREVIGGRTTCYSPGRQRLQER
jgi:formamidopyrimidine-DNA glycosylase